jgi:hypothetical protein
MAYPTPAVTVTTAATFIPEIWSDEIVASYKKNLVLANIVMKMNFKGKKGDTVHIPAPTRGSATAKAASTAVTLIADTETEIQVSINQHFEYSRFIEDIVEAQALNSLRQFYTADAGYYTEQAFIGNGNAIRNGEIGQLYGIPVFTTSNADTGAGNTATDRICLMGHKDSMVLVEQMGIRSQTQYKQDYLATLFTSDTLYGVKAMRTAATTGAALSSSAFALAVPA